MPATASGLLVAESRDSSNIPLASASGWLYSPSHVRIVITASPEATLDVGLDLQCSRGNIERRVQHDLEPQIGPVRRRVKLPMSKPGECYIDATASYVDFEHSGTVVARVYGHGRLNQY